MDIISKMEYVILTHYRVPTKILYKSIISAMKQSNCVCVKVAIPEKGDSVLKTRIEAFKSVKTEYFVSMDDDVTLKTDWIEEIWPYVKKDTVIGGIVATSQREVKYRESIKKPLKREQLGKVQNTILRREWFIDMKYPKEIGVDDHMFINMKLLEQGLDWYLVPVISVHTIGYKPAEFEEGIRAAARRRRLGVLNSWKEVLKATVGHIISGVKISLRTRDSFFITYFTKMGLGYIIGFGHWDKYCIKYDYSTRW